MSGWLALGAFVFCACSCGQSFAVDPQDSTQNVFAENPLPKKIRFEMYTLGVVNQPGKGVPMYTGPCARMQAYCSQTCQTVLDVGAFTGMDHVVAGLSQGHRVIAFEPNEINAKAIVANVDHIVGPGRVTMAHVEYDEVTGRAIPPKIPPSGCWTGEYGHAFVLPIVVTNVTKPTTFHSNADIGSAASQSFWQNGEMHSWSVATVPGFALDDIIDENIWYMKLDVQGGELAALQGAARILEKYRVPYIMTEFWPAGISAAGGDSMEMLNLLHRYGYECHHVHGLFGGDATNGKFVSSTMEDDEYLWRVERTDSGVWSDDMTFQEYVDVLQERAPDPSSQFGGYQSDLMCVRRFWKGSLI